MPTSPTNGLRGLSADELSLMQHVIMFGSDGYPVKKVGSKHWSWSYLSVSSPRIFPTKTTATLSFESFMDVLRDAKAGRV